MANTFVGVDEARGAGFGARLERWRGMWRWGLGTLRMFWKFTREKPAYTRPQGEIPVVKMTRASIVEAADRTLWRLGHSSVLLKLDGGLFLTDPVFGKRASPVWFAGPKRFHAPPLRVKDLPAVKAVILSHDHYDHLDKRAVLKLARKCDLFLTTHGVGEHLVRWGVDRAKVRELEWWEGIDVGRVRVTATPTQHFSGRSLWDRNSTGWASWVIEDRNGEHGFKIFYGSDSGYFPGFKEIGERFGPFDVTLIENGAYNVRWPTIHMQPEETLAVHRDVRGKWLVPIHHGTFDLALHPWTEPMERVQALAEKAGVQVSTPRFGEPMRMDQMGRGDCWWRGVDPPRF